LVILVVVSQERFEAHRYLAGRKKRRGAIYPRPGLTTDDQGYRTPGENLGEAGSHPR